MAFWKTKRLPAALAIVVVTIGLVACSGPARSSRLGVRNDPDAPQYPYDWQADLERIERGSVVVPRGRFDAPQRVSQLMDFVSYHRDEVFEDDHARYLRTMGIGMLLADRDIDSLLYLREYGRVTGRPFEGTYSYLYEASWHHTHPVRDFVNIYLEHIMATSPPLTEREFTLAGFLSPRYVLSIAPIEYYTPYLDQVDPDDLSILDPDARSVVEADQIISVRAGDLDSGFYHIRALLAAEEVAAANDYDTRLYVFSGYVQHAAYDRALEVSRTIDVERLSIGRLSYYSRILEVLYRTGEYEEIVDLTSEQRDNEYLMVQTAKYVGGNYWLAMAYLGLEQYDRALATLQDALDAATRRPMSEFNPTNPSSMPPFRRPNAYVLYWFVVNGGFYDRFEELGRGDEVIKLLRDDRAKYDSDLWVS